MRVLVLVLLVGCTGIKSEYPTLSLECRDPRSCDGKLGVGGIVFANRGVVISRNEDIVHVESKDYYPLVGVAPGTAEIDLLDGDTVVDSVDLNVSALSELRMSSQTVAIDGPLLDAQYDAAYKVPANTLFGLELLPMIDGALSIGTHYYMVVLDGSPIDCYGDAPRVCTGPVWYDHVPIDPLDAGDHVLDLQPTDGGRRFMFRLSAH